MRIMPSIVRGKYDSLPKATQNNARRMFRDDWEWAKGNTLKEAIFADKYGLYYEGKHVIADHLVFDSKPFRELDKKEIKNLLANNIF